MNKIVSYHYTVQSNSSQHSTMHLVKKQLLFGIVFGLFFVLSQQSFAQEACIDVFEPVCGTDGVTYVNTCFAGAIPIEHSGPCTDQTSQPLNENTSVDEPENDNPQTTTPTVENMSTEITSPPITSAIESGPIQMRIFWEGKNTNPIEGTIEISGEFYHVSPLLFEEKNNGQKDNLSWSQGGNGVSFSTISNNERDGLLIQATLDTPEIFITINGQKESITNTKTVTPIGEITVQNTVKKTVQDSNWYIGAISTDDTGKELNLIGPGEYSPLENPLNITSNAEGKILRSEIDIQYIEGILEESVLDMEALPFIVHKNDTSIILTKAPMESDEEWISTMNSLLESIHTLEELKKNTSRLQLLEEDRHGELTSQVDNLISTLPLTQENLQQAQLTLSNYISILTATKGTKEEIIIATNNVIENIVTIVKSAQETPSIEFTDVPEKAWFKEYIVALKTKNILSGYKNNDGIFTGKFGPGNNVTRAETLKIALEAAKTPTTKEGDFPFSDSKNHWAQNYIHRALSHNIIRNSSEFSPDKPADRAWVVEVVLKSFGVEPSDEQLVGNCFPDVPNGSPSEYYLCIGKELGIIAGDPDGNFYPGRPINRAETAKIVRNTLFIFFGE